MTPNGVEVHHHRSFQITDHEEKISLCESQWAKTRVGRGEASKGKTAGRGTKGTKARYQVPARFEGGQMPLHMRLPKLKGFKNPNRVEFQVVNVAALEKLYPAGGDVTVADLVAKGAVRRGQKVKILGLGDIGALASKPVMEGKSVLFSKFAGVEAIDICVDTKDPE